MCQRHFQRLGCAFNESAREVSHSREALNQSEMAAKKSWNAVSGRSGRNFQGANYRVFELNGIYSLTGVFKH